MRRNLLITTAAAALAAGTMFAAAQGVQKQAPDAAAEPGVQGQMPQGKEKGKAESKQPKTQGQGGQAQSQPGNEKGKAQSKEPQTQGQGGGQGGTERDRSDGQRDGAQPKAQREGQGQRDGQGQKGAETKGGKGAGGNVQLTIEQRTKIRTTVLQGGNAPRVTNVNFNINVGTVVPRTVRVVAVPAVLVEVHPEWSGFMYFVVDDRIIIVDSNHHIVAVLVV